MNTVERLVDMMDRAGVLYTGALDAAVHEAAASAASRISNGGEDARLEYLLRMLGEEETEAAVLNAVGKPVDSDRE